MENNKINVATSTTQKNEVVEYIRKSLGTIKNIPKSSFVKNDNTIVIGETIAKTPNGKEIECVKVNVLPSDSDLQEISLIAQLNGITINDLILQRFYVIPLNNKLTLFKKYTQIVREFKQDNTDLAIDFEINGDFLTCICFNTTTDKKVCKSFVALSEYSAGKGLSQLERAKIGAFKNLIRFNFPKYVDFYDEYDLEIIKGENNQKKSNLLEQAQKEING
jgi:hypothetical protein